MKCLYCPEELPIRAIEYGHHCPNIGDGEGICIRTKSVADEPNSMAMLLDLARQVSNVMPSAGSTWGAQARAAMAQARKEGFIR